jgi:cholesterol oxidase
VYLPHLERLAIPLAFVHGAKNECFLPESTAKSVAALRERNGDLYQRHVIPGYGHIDCIFGREAARDVYPFILDHLERT